MTEWNIETLRAYLDTRLDALQREFSVRFDASAEALRLAKEAQDYRDARDNRLREQIESERVEYVSKEELTAFRREYQASLKPLEEFVVAQRAANLERSQSKTEGRAHVDTTTRLLAVALAVLSLGLGFLAYRAGSTTKVPLSRTVTVTVPVR